MVVPEEMVPDPASAQTTLPDESVVNAPPFVFDVQLAVPILNPPALMLIPPSKEEVAVEVFLMEPAVMVRPAEVFNPTDEIPPEKVLVLVFVTVRFAAVVEPRSEAIFWARILPPVTVRPLEEERPLVPTPPANVDVPVPKE